MNSRTLVDKKNKRKQKINQSCKDLIKVAQSIKEANLSPAKPLQWRHIKHDGVSNHRRLDCLLNCLFRRRSKKTSKFRVTGLCEGNSPVSGEFPAQRASNAENVSIWWEILPFRGFWSRKTPLFQPKSLILIVPIIGTLFQQISDSRR